MSFRGISREIPCDRTGTKHIRASQMPAAARRPWGISPLHSDCCPHSGRNDIIKPNERRRHFERHREIPRGRNETKRTRYAAGRGRPALPTASSALKPDALSFRALVEKSPAIETKRNIYAPAKCPRRLCAEKSPAIETKPNEHEYPKYLPARSPCLARAGSAPRNSPR